PTLASAETKGCDGIRCAGGRLQRIQHYCALDSVEMAASVIRVPHRNRTHRESPVSASPRILRNFVNGEYVEPESDATSEVVSPVTAKVVAMAPVSSAADVD